MRYNKQNIFTNEEKAYKRFLKMRGATLINQYDTPKFRFPDQNSMAKFSSIQHVWSLGDRYYKLSYAYYGNYDYWWVIALFNGKPTEGHLEYGDVLKIPTNPESILRIA